MVELPPPEPTIPPEEEEPPPLGSWRRMYVLVIGVLALEILLFYLFTLAFD